MRHTAVGLIASNDGLAADRTRQRSAWASPASEYRSVQPARIPVDRDHNHRWVGQIVHLERCDAGIVAVAELDIPEPALIVRVGDERVALRDPTYFSAEFDSDSDGRDIELVSVAICHGTASLSAQPLTWYEGDLAHRSGWHTNTFQRPLLNRAAETDHTRHGRPLVIHGHIDARRGAHAPAPPGPAAVDGLLLRNAQTVDVRPSRREIEIVCVPYETGTLVPFEGRMVTESFARGAFADIQSQTNRIRVNRDHDVQRTVGRATAFHPHRPEGLVAELAIAPTELGDETLALATNDCLDASIAFRPTRGGLTWQGRSAYRVDRAFLGHIAMTPDPAYVDARVLAVRAGALTT